MLFSIIHYVNFLFLVLAGSIELQTSVPPVLPEIHLLDVLFKSPEMHIQLVQVFQQGAEGRTLCHLGKGIDILGEALATVAELAVRTGDVGVGVVDVAGQQHAGVHLAPVGSHLLAILAAGVEVGDLVGTKDIVHILGQLSLQRGHHGELFTHENLGEQVLCAGEDHGLLAEVLEEGALGEELGHIAHLMAGLLGEAFTGAGEDGSAHEYGHIRQVGDEFLHQGEVLRAVVLGRNVNLQEGNIDTTQVIVVPLGRVADEQFALWIVMLQPIFKGSAYEATSNNSNVNHFYQICFKIIIKLLCSGRQYRTANIYSTCAARIPL